MKLRSKKLLDVDQASAEYCASRMDCESCPIDEAMKSDCKIYDCVRLVVDEVSMDACQRGHMIRLLSVFCTPVHAPERQHIKRGFYALPAGAHQTLFRLSRIGRNIPLGSSDLERSFNGSTFSREMRLSPL